MSSLLVTKATCGKTESHEQRYISTSAPQIPCTDQIWLGPHSPHMSNRFRLLPLVLSEFAVKALLSLKSITLLLLSISALSAIFVLTMYVTCIIESERCIRCAGYKDVASWTLDWLQASSSYWRRHNGSDHIFTFTQDHGWDRRIFQTTNSSQLAWQQPFLHSGKWGIWSFWPSHSLCWSCMQLSDTRQWAAEPHLWRFQIWDIGWCLVQDNHYAHEASNHDLRNIRD